MLAHRVVALVMIATAACSLPSVHGLHDDAHAVDDPGLVGTWTDAGGDVAAKITRTGFGAYTVDTVVTDTPLRFSARLVQLEHGRFVDMVLVPDALEALDRSSFGMAIPTHQFARVTRAGDTLEFVAPDEQAWVLAAQRDGVEIAATTSPPDPTPRFVVIAPTPKLQRFFAAHAQDKVLFVDPLMLHRARRTP